MKKHLFLFFFFMIIVAFSSCSNSVSDGSDSDPHDNIVEQVAKPVFSFDSGDIDPNSEIEISCSTSGAVIHYTTDGSEPTSNSPEYSSAIKVTSAIRIKAIAVKTGFNTSDVAIGIFTIKGVIANPVIEPDKDSLLLSETVKIFNFYSDDSVEIFYTTDGTEPDTSSTRYTKDEVLSHATTPMTFKAVAVRKYDNLKSEIVSKTYKIRVASPIFSNMNEGVDVGTSITLSVPDGCSVYYTIDGSIPTSSSIKYESPIVIDVQKTIKAISIPSDSNYANSDVVEHTYNPLIFYVSDTGNDATGNGSISSPYATIEKAFTVAKSNTGGHSYIIRLLSDITLSSEVILNIPSGITVTLESSDATIRTFDGCKIIDRAISFTGAGNVILKNIKTINTKNGIYTKSDYSGTLTLNHVSVRTWREGYNDGNGGEGLNLEGGIINIEYVDADDNPKMALYAGGSSKVTITDMSSVVPERASDDIDGNPKYIYTNSIVAADTAEVTINGGTYSGCHECIGLWGGTPKVIINAGDFGNCVWSSVSLFRDEDHNGSIVVNGGTFKKNLSIYRGTLNITGGTFYDGVYITEIGTASIEGGTFKGQITVSGGNVAISNITVSDSPYCGICVSGGTASIDGCKIQNATNDGINISGGTATIVGCTCQSNTKQGIYMNGGSATITDTICKKNAESGIIIDSNGTINEFKNVECIENNTYGIFYGVEKDCIFSNVKCYSNGQAVYIAGGNITINGTESRYETEAGYEGIWLKSGNLTVNGGTFKGTNRSINGSVDNTYTITINSGNLKKVVENRKGTTIINGGILSEDIFTTVGTIEALGGTINSLCIPSCATLKIGGNIEITDKISFYTENSSVNTIKLVSNLTNSVDLYFQNNTLGPSVLEAGTQILSNDGESDYVSTSYSKFNFKSDTSYTIDSTGKLVSK